MKQLTATNHLTGMKIVERYVDGIKYMKVTPKNLLPLILENLKKQLTGQPVKIEKSETGWIKIEKTGESDKLKQAGEKAIGKNQDVDEDYILNTEAEMLKKQGFAVKVEEIK